MKRSSDNLRGFHNPSTRLFPPFLLILLSFSVAPASLAQDDFSVGTLPDSQRMRALADVCADLESNTLCYGGGMVEVTTNGIQAARCVSHSAASGGGSGNSR